MPPTRSASTANRHTRSTIIRSSDQSSAAPKASAGNASATVNQAMRRSNGRAGLAAARAATLAIGSDPEFLHAAIHGAARQAERMRRGRSAAFVTLERRANQRALGILQIHALERRRLLCPLLQTKIGD